MKGGLDMFFTDPDHQFKLLSVIALQYNGRGWSEQTRDFDVLSFRVKGHARYQFEGRQFSVESGDLMYIPAWVLG